MCHDKGTSHKSNSHLTTAGKPIKCDHHNFLTNFIIFLFISHFTLFFLYTYCTTVFIPKQRCRTWGNSLTTLGQPPFASHYQVKSMYFWKTINKSKRLYEQKQRQYRKMQKNKKQTKTNLTPFNERNLL